MNMRPFPGLAPNWYQDGVDQGIIRYWDGSQITAERHWDGTLWVDWWLASDGEFYPPNLHPAAPVPESADAIESAVVDRSDPFASTPATSPRRRRKVLALGAVGVVIALVVALVVGLSTPKNAEAAVLGAVNSTLADKTAHVSLTMSAGTQGQAVTASGNGGIDFSQNALQMDFSVGAGGQSLSMQAIYLGGTVYESLPEVSEIEPGKSWVSEDLSSITSATGSEASNSLGVEGNPAEMLRMLAEHGNTVTPIGASTINGVSVQGYSVTIGAAQIRSQLSSVPDWVRTVLTKVGIKAIDYKVYVDGQGLLRRTTISMGIAAEGTTITIGESLDFSDYGSPVDISALPADQVVSLQQFVQDAQALQAPK